VDIIKFPPGASSGCQVGDLWYDGMISVLFNADMNQQRTLFQVAENTSYNHEGMELKEELNVIWTL
jgi:hypothetical protein